VTVTVAAVNDAPVGNNQSVTTNEDAAKSGTVTATDVDNSASSLTYAKVTDAAHGTVTVNPNGFYTYTPAPNYHGTDSFTFKANDGSLDSAPATVTITVNPVNDTPAAVADTAGTNEDNAVTVSVLANDNGLGDGPVTVAIATPPASGTATVNPAENTVTYTPPADFNGTATFTYTVTDADTPTGQSSTATVTVTVNPVNDEPTASGTSISTNEDTPSSGTLSAADADADPLTYSVTDAPDHGTLAVNASTGSYIYTPTADYHGSDSFSFQVSDGTASSDTATVAVTVNPVNDNPNAADDAVASAGGAVNFDVKANDTDVDDTDVSAHTVTLLTATDLGTISCTSVGACTYTPDAALAPGTYTDSFQYQLSDPSGGVDAATVTITITKS
jgi:VCBS repeat-containing protein